MSDEKKKEKVINIQKFQPKQISEFSKEPMPYTQICNTVINHCQNPVAGFIWIYLQSKPETWRPCKWEIMKRFDISEPTYKRHMRYLSATGLVEHHQDRNEDGTVGCSRIVVLNGSRFNPNGVEYKGVVFDTVRDTDNYDPTYRNPIRGIKNDTAVDPAPEAGSDRGIKNDTAVINRGIKKPPTGEMTPHINKRLTTIEKKDLNLPSTDVEDYMVSFERFYSAYPRKKGRQDAIKWFKRMKPNAEFVSMLIADVNKRTATEWSGKDSQYLPYPATYLNGKRWEDAIESPSTSKSSYDIKYPSKEERAAENERILARERASEQAKREEIADSENYKNIVTQMTSRFDFQEQMKIQEADRISQGLTHKEYHQMILNQANRKN